MDEIEEQSNGTARTGVFWSIESIEIPQCFFVYTKDWPKFWRIVNYFWRKLFNGFLFESRAEENRIIRHFAGQHGWYKFVAIEDHQSGEIVLSYEI